MGVKMSSNTESSLLTVRVRGIEVRWGAYGLQTVKHYEKEV
jgi:hypothetical protein